MANLEPYTSNGKFVNWSVETGTLITDDTG